MAKDYDLQWTKIDQLYDAVQQFLSPPLSTAKIDLWDPTTWRWQ